MARIRNFEEKFEVGDITNGEVGLKLNAVGCMMRHAEHDQFRQDELRTKADNYLTESVFGQREWRNELYNLGKAHQLLAMGYVIGRMELEEFIKEHEERLGE